MLQFYINFYSRSRHYEIEWLNLSKKVTNQVAWIEPIELELSIRFYPHHYDELISDTTKKLFYLHVQKLIVSGVLVADLETLLLLASLQATAKYGQYLVEFQNDVLMGALINDDFFPMGKN